MPKRKNFFKCEYDEDNRRRYYEGASVLISFNPTQAGSVPFCCHAEFLLVSAFCRCSMVF